MSREELDEKLYHAVQLKEVLNEQQLKELVATVCVNYYLDNMENQTSRQLLVDQVNLILKSLNIESMSYKFFRKFKMK